MHFNLLNRKYILFSKLTLEVFTYCWIFCGINETKSEAYWELFINSFLSVLIIAEVWLFWEKIVFSCKKKNFRAYTLKFFKIWSITKSLKWDLNGNRVVYNCIVPWISQKKNSWPFIILSRLFISSEKKISYLSLTFLRSLSSHILWQTASEAESTNQNLASKKY